MAPAILAARFLPAKSWSLIGPGQLIPATPGANWTIQRPTLGDHGSVQRDSRAIDLHLGGAGRCSSPGFSFRRDGTGDRDVRRAHVGPIPSSSRTVRSWSLHTRFHWQRTSGRRESGRLDQYRLYADTGRQCRLTLCDRGRPRRPSSDGRDRRSISGLDLDQKDRGRDADRCKDSRRHPNGQRRAGGSAGGEHIEPGGRHRRGAMKFEERARA